MGTTFANNLKDIINTYEIGSIDEKRLALLLLEELWSHRDENDSVSRILLKAYNSIAKEYQK